MGYVISDIDGGFVGAHIRVLMVAIIVAAVAVVFLMIMMAR